MLTADEFTALIDGVTGLPYGDRTGGPSASAVLSPRDR